MKFIYVLDPALKDQLLNQGYNLLVKTERFFIFENNKLNFNFNTSDKSKYFFTNKYMI